MITYEYKMISVENRFVLIDRELATAGDAGWLLVHMQTGSALHFRGDDPPVTRVNLWFVRPKEAQDK